MAIPHIEVRVGGRKIGGWTSVRLIRAMDDLAWAYQCTVWDRWRENRLAASVFPWDAGQPIEFLVDGKVALTGYVDEVGVDYDASTHRVVLTGRSKAGDLIDCSPAAKQKRWKDATIMRIAKDLADPFGIAVKAASDAIPPGFLNPFDKFAVEEGERVFDTLERLARYRGVFVTSNEMGEIVFTQASKKALPTTLKTGNDQIIQARRTGSLRERYSVYVVKTQTKGTDVWNGDAAAKGVATAEDAGVGRFRPITILPDGGDHSIGLKQRARWQRNTAAGRSKQIQYVLRGWYTSEEAADAELWRPNRLVKIEDQFLNAKGTLLITRAELMLDSQGGERTRLTLTHPDAFSTLRNPKRKIDEDLFGIVRMF